MPGRSSAPRSDSLPLRFVIGTVGAALALGACSTGFSKTDAVDAFQSTNPDASTNEAVCVIDALIETYEAQPVDEDDLRGLEAELAVDPPRQAFVLEQYRAMFGCGMTADVENQLRRELVTNGIDPDAVDCVAEELAENLTDDDLDVLISDEMNDSFYATFFTAVENCDALPE